MTKDYGMFSDKGNQIIENIVDRAREDNLSWPQVITLLEHTYKLAKISKQHTECLDTEVRECIYNELGFYEKDQDFYA
jgi:hypothetical protein